MVEEPTRGNNILDVVLCSDALCCDDVEVLPPISTSDHNNVCFQLNISFACKQQSVSELSCRRNFAKADWNGIRDSLSSIDWHAAFCNCSSVEELWQAFTVVIEQAVDIFFPSFKPSNMYQHQRSIRDIFASCYLSKELDGNYIILTAHLSYE